MWLKYQPIVDNFGIDFHPCARGHRKRRPGVPHQEPFLRPAPPFWRLGRTEGPFLGTMGPQGATWRARGTHEHRKPKLLKRPKPQNGAPAAAGAPFSTFAREPDKENETNWFRGGGVTAGMEAPIQPPLSTRPADQRTHTRLHTPGDPRGSADSMTHSFDLPLALYQKCTGKTPFLSNACFLEK